MDRDPYVDGQRLIFRDKIHTILTNFAFYFPEEFEKTSIKVCEKCDGSGLPCKKLAERGAITFWQPGTICDKCGGFGYKFSEINGQYICKKCNGVGCSKCNYGFTDWISHAMGR
jgi:hypothetical protein